MFVLVVDRIVHDKLLRDNIFSLSFLGINVKSSRQGGTQKFMIRPFVSRIVIRVIPTKFKLQVKFYTEIRQISPFDKTSQEAFIIWMIASDESTIAFRWSYALNKC